MTLIRNAVLGRLVYFEILISSIPLDQDQFYLKLGTDHYEIVQICYNI